MSKILITGAVGHIGSALLKELLKLSGKIIIIDSFKNNNYQIFFNTRNKFQIIDEDLMSFNLNKLKDIKTIIHLAAETNASDQQKFKSKFYLNYNFNLTKKIVDFSKKNKSRLIYISSTSVYGSQKNRVDENTELKDLNPESVYAKQKIREEKYIKKYVKNYIILRFGTIFGFSKGIRFHTAINKFVWQSYVKKPITIWKSNINLPRPYLSLIDGVRFIKLLLKRKDIKCETFNLVTKNYTLYQIITILKRYNKKLKVKLVSPPILNQTSYFVDNKKSLDLKFKYIGNLDREIKKIFSKILILNG